MRHVHLALPGYRGSGTCGMESGPLAGGTAGMDAEASRRQLAAALWRVVAGDRAALRIVYQDTSAKLFGVCLRILHDKSEAEDVLQDVYVTVWRKAADFDPGRASPISATGNTLVIVPAALLTKDLRAYELWLIPAGETRPRSLGLPAGSTDQARYPCRPRRPGHAGCHARCLP